MSNIFYDGRNYIPRKNSKSKCLLENYVEERAVAELDKEREMKKGQTSIMQSIKHGHQGLITTNFNAHTEDLTSSLDAYRPNTGPFVRTKGSRRELRENMLLEQAIKEVEAPPFVDECVSTFQQDYNIDDFVARKPAPTVERDYTREQPVSFWTEHRDKIHAVSQVRPTFNTCFRKNSAFSQPISERWEPEHVMPYERDHVPNM